MAPLLLDPAPRSLQQSMGCLSLLLLFFTLLHLSIARIFRGNKRGSGLSVFIIIPTYITAFLVFTLVLAVLSLFTLRLFTFPALAGSNNELVLSFLAILSLTYSGLLGCDRRRRLVAVYLASIPCFGNGDHSSSHQLLAAERDPILCFGPQFISSHAKSFDSQTEESSSSQARSSLKTTLTKPAGIVRKKFLEVSCRTAHTWVFGRPKQQAWVSFAMKVSFFNAIALTISVEPYVCVAYQRCARLPNSQKILCPHKGPYSSRRRGCGAADAILSTVAGT